MFVAPVITTKPTSTKKDNTMNYQHALQQLHSLRLTGMAAAFEQQMEQPNTYQDLGFI